MKPHKIHLHYHAQTGMWRVRWGNEHLETANLIIFCQLIAHPDGDMSGLGVVEQYGHDTLVLRNN